MKKIAILVAASTFCLNVFAAEVTEKEAKEYFWNKVVDSIQTEAPDYFELFSKDAKIHYTFPKSYEMENGEVKLSDFKETQEEFWNYTENHSFDLEEPVVKTEGDKAVVSTTFYERYTMEGYTLANEAKHKYTLAKVDGKLKIVEFNNVITDLTEQEYEEKKEAKAVKK
ncbi:hypothetical protein [Endozoicomonas arenosclerae]|uniref:hypothetical protein n=1 Tax=Endozoicomonas arenosclerae TaxID=1633495 RepID=UPI000782AA31|nr:hypothetical protein [Endozoicomonas arenosclerae]